MKILNSFDTELQSKVYNKYVELYGTENVQIINKGKIFLTFYIIVPLILILLIIFLLKIYGFLIVFEDSFINNLKWIKIFLLIFLLFPYILILIKRYIDYIMDFLIITPKEIIYYNQTGIFSHQVISLDVDKLTTINLNRKGLIKSLLNYGEIFIATEGDATITIYYIDNPLNKLELMKQITRNLKK